MFDRKELPEVTRRVWGMETQCLRKFKNWEIKESHKTDKLHMVTFFFFFFLMNPTTDCCGAVLFFTEHLIVQCHFSQRKNSFLPYQMQ